MRGQRLGPYEILRPLASGGMGDVYLARDRELERDVALKVLPDEVARDQERQRRLRQEARTLAALDHPNVVSVYAVGESDGIAYIAMQLVEGRTLADRLAEGPLEIPEVFELAACLVDAVASAHEHGIVHGDLKPGNVVLGDDGRLRILDFGLARRVLGEPGSAADDDRTAPLAEGIEGTMGYMAPELLRGASPDLRCDVFSLGVILYMMACGRPPYDGETAAERMASLLRDDPRPPETTRPDLPPALGAIIERCLARDPADRYASAAELRRELGAIETAGAAGDGPERTPSLGVLPFTDLSPERDQGYFCDGLAEELLIALARITGLRVASRTSSFQFKDSSLDVRDVGRRLGVEMVLEGSVRKAGNRLRVAVRLVDIGSGYQIWSSRYDRDLEDVFAIQEEIAESIVDSLRLRITPEERRALQGARTHDVEAYELLLRGKQLFHSKSTGNYEIARPLFEAAIKRDPEFGQAYAAVADCCSFQYMYTEPTEANLDRALEASVRALEYDPESAGAHASRALALSLRDRHEEAEQEFETAVRLDPRHFDAHYLYARYCHSRGWLERAVELYARAASIDPDDYEALLLATPLYRKLGHDAEAQAAARRGLLAVERYLRTHPEDGRAAQLAAGAAIELGDVERARARAETALEQFPTNIGVLYNAACAFAQLRDVDRGLDCLERAVALGFAHRDWIENDPDLDPLHGNPRYEALLRRLADDSLGTPGEE